MDLDVLQAMDLTSLRAVVTDLRTEILPSRFEKVQQPDQKTLQIALRTLQGLKWLELNWGPNVPRLVQLKAPNKQGSESTLAQQIQHGLSKMALVEIKQSGFERVVMLCLAQRPGAPIERTLVIEIMGRHSNLLFLDDKQKVIALGKQIRESQSRFRPISTGDVYFPPPKLKGLKPDSNLSFAEWKKTLSLLPISTRKRSI